MSYDPRGTKYGAVDANTGPCLRKMPDDNIYLRPNDKVSGFKKYLIVLTFGTIITILLYAWFFGQ